MDESSIYVHLQGVVERSKGAVLWSDVCLGLARAKESKLREQLASLFSEMDLATIHKAHEIAQRETLKPLPVSVSVTAPPAQPAAKVAPMHASPKSKAGSVKR